MKETLEMLGTHGQTQPERPGQEATTGQPKAPEISDIGDQVLEAWTRAMRASDIEC